MMGNNNKYANKYWTKRKEQRKKEIKFIKLKTKITYHWHNNCYMGFKYDIAFYKYMDKVKEEYKYEIS